MKLMKFSGIFLFVVCAILTTTRFSYAGWKGTWYLRGATECKEINLDRKGKTTIGVYPKAVVEKKEGNYFLSVESMGKKYSYKMIDRTGPDFDLELISVGPNQPIPEAKPVEGAYTAIFRRLVDCQTQMKGVTETPIK